MMRYVYAHQPALTPQEAALLPALPTSTRGTRLCPNLLVAGDESSFIPMDAQPITECGNFAYSADGRYVSWSVNGQVYREPQSDWFARHGSMAGRAVLSAAGVSLPGVEGMSRGCRRAQDRQVIDEVPMTVLELL